MIDIKFLRENPDVVKENIKKKFQEHKLPLVDEVIEYDKKARATQQEADDLRASRNKLSKEIGALMKEGKKDEANKVKEQVTANAARLAELEELEREYSAKVKEDMMMIPNIIDASVPIGPDDSCNVENEKYGEPVVPDFEVPYHTEIMDRFDGIEENGAFGICHSSIARRKNLLGNILLFYHERHKHVLIRQFLVERLSIEAVEHIVVLDGRV